MYIYPPRSCISKDSADRIYTRDLLGWLRLGWLKRPYIYIYIYRERERKRWIYIYIYIYIHRERERLSYHSLDHLDTT